MSDDSADGFATGSLWYDASANVLYICEDPTAGAAVWEQVGGGGSGAADITVTASPTGVEVDAGGTTDSIPIATETNAGVVAPADQAKINNVPADTTTTLAGKQDVLSEGAFADGDKDKLDGIAAGAEANRALASQAEAEAGRRTRRA